MRLSCPNCGAQYEVPIEVIPQDGRDVQCSNCGHTWFQIHPDQDVELAHEVGGSIPDEGWQESEDNAADASDALVEDPALHDSSSEVQPPEPEFEEETSEHPADEPLGEDGADNGNALAAFEDDSPEDQKHEADLIAPQQGVEEDDEDPAQQPAEPQRAPRSAIDPAIAGVLREEAEYEATVREAEAREALETQTELGLDAPRSETETRAAEARARMRRIQGLPETEPEEEAPQTELGHSDHALDEAAQGSRRDLLPDIDEINSTLRSADDRNATEGGVAAIAVKRRKRSGFRLGFGFVMLFAAVVLMAYVYNREIIAAFPASEPYVIGFMETMNSLRVWLDTRVTEAMLWLDSVAESAGGNVD